MTIKISNWTTTRGGIVELHTQHLTEEKNTNDWGIESFTPIDRIRINKVTLNGKEYNTMIGRKEIQNTSVLDLGRDIIDGKKVQLYVPIPPGIEQDVWGAYDARQKAKREAEKAIRNRNVESLKNKEARGYCSKCGSYCYGDCEV